MKSVIDVLIFLFCVDDVSVAFASPLTLLLNPHLSSPSNQTLVTLGNASATLPNELPPEPFHYAVPYHPLTLTFSSYGHYLDKDILLSLFQQAYHDASLEIMAKGPAAYIGPGHHVYTNSAVGIMFYLTAENLHMCWIFFREAMNGMQQVVGHFGGEELEFEVEHDVWGLLATGAFKGR